MRKHRDRDQNNDQTQPEDGLNNLVEPGAADGGTEPDLDSWLHEEPRAVDLNGDEESEAAPSDVDLHPTETQGAEDVDGQGGSLASVSGPVRLMVAVLGFAALGVAVGLGVNLLRSGDTAPAPQPGAVGAQVTLDESVGDGKPLTSDNDLRGWNMDAAGRISPLVSQLARPVRTTLGGQQALCREQRLSLQGVLDLSTPPEKAVGEAFDAWRAALERSLDNCVSAVPSGDDASDVKRLAESISGTEPLFAEFLKVQRPLVDVRFDANPEAFEGR